MSSTDLMIVSDDITQQTDRRAALERLNQAAEAAATPAEAREVMVTAAAISDVLIKARAPWEEAWLAGKASVLAARRLGKLFSGLSNKPVSSPGWGGGSEVSERGRVSRELGISSTMRSYLIRLGKADDPSFQRYIQSREKIPSVNGALLATSLMKDRGSQVGSSWNEARRKRAGVKVAKNPSIDKANEHIRKALGHLSGVHGGAGVRSVSRAMDALYEAEDLLKPYLGGYVGTNTKKRTAA